MVEAKLRTLSGGLWRLLDDQIGDERIIGMRREVAKLHNMVNECDCQRRTKTSIVVGSQAEGLALNDTDSDHMFVYFHVKVQQGHQDQNNDHNMENIMTVRMEQNHCKPGFTLLKIVDGQKQNCTKILNGDYLSSQKWKGNSHFNHPSSRTIGPSISGTLGGSAHDLTEAIKLKFWPEVARGCIHRLLRGEWLDKKTVLEMVKQNCHLVPKSSRISRYPDEEWMISFVTAEQILIAKLTHSQFLCYCLLKIFFKEAVNDVLKTKAIDEDFLSSYFAKTVILWQASDGRLHCNSDNLLWCFWSCFRLILKWLSKNFVPNFFIPTNNMLEGKFTKQNRQKLMTRLTVLYSKGYRCLYECSTLKNEQFVHSQHFSNKLRSDHVLSEVGSPFFLKVRKKYSRQQVKLRSKDRVGMIWVTYPEAIVGLQSQFYSSFVLAIENQVPCVGSYLKEPETQADLVKRIELVQKKITSKTDVQEHTLATWFHIFSIRLVFTYFMQVITKSETENRMMYHIFRKVKAYILKDRDDLVTEKLYYAIILYEMGKDDGIMKKLAHTEKVLEKTCVVPTFMMDSSGVESSLEQIEAKGNEIQDFRTWKRKCLVKQIELKTDITISDLKLEHLAAESYSPLFDSIIYPPLFLCYILHFLLLYRKQKYKKCSKILDRYNRYLRYNGSRFVKRRDLNIITEVYGILNFMLNNYDKAYAAYVESLNERSTISRATWLRILVLVWKKKYKDKEKRRI